MRSCRSKTTSIKLSQIAVLHLSTPENPCFPHAQPITRVLKLTLNLSFSMVFSSTNALLFRTRAQYFEFRNAL